jgi:hypothetical protein
LTWKIAEWSSKSSEGNRVLRPLVECDSEGEILVHDIETDDNQWNKLGCEAVPNNLFGEPQGPNAIKYLIFDPESTEKYSGVGILYNDPVKDVSNDNANYTSFGIAYYGWSVFKATNVPLHELFHSLGAVQGGSSEPPPYSGSAHCIDGLDVMCYNDGGTWEGKEYSNEYCPGPFENFPVEKPIDCGEDTYFDADPEPSSWLDTHWNVAGPENPFLVAPPTEATTGGTSERSIESARLHGSLNPEGYDVAVDFEYGLTDEYGSVAQSTTPDLDGVIDFGADPVQATGVVDGLAPETTYHYRLVATGPDGATFYGEDKTFTTTSSLVPAVETESATNPLKQEATLNATINPRGLPTEYSFEIWREEWQWAGDPSRTNYLTNPSFEADLSDWEELASGGSPERTESESYDGAASMAISGEGSSEGAGTTALPVDPSTTYTASAWVKAPVGGSFSLDLGEESESEELGMTSTGEVEGSGEWTRISATRAFGSEGNRARVRVKLASEGSIRVDAMLLEAAEEAGSYFPRIRELEYGQAVQHEDGSYEMATPTYAPASKEGDAGEGETPVELSETLEGLEHSTASASESSLKTPKVAPMAKP